MTEMLTRANPSRLEGVERFGIRMKSVLGVSVPELRAFAKRIGRNHQLAAKLWAQGSLESRTLASLIDEPALVTPRQMDSWVKDLESWADCDAVCCNLFDKTPFAVEKALLWSSHEKEYIKRAGFVLMAAMAVHNKSAPDDLFLGFFPILKREAHDNRNFVKKAVNWALRQIGKRNATLRAAAIKSAQEIYALGSPSARWIANDALREFKNTPVKSS